MEHSYAVEYLWGLLPFRPREPGRDVKAGVTLASMNIPQVLGYTRIAGTPVITVLLAAHCVCSNWLLQGDTDLVKHEPVVGRRNKFDAARLRFGLCAPRRGRRRPPAHSGRAPSYAGDSCVGRA